MARASVIIPAYNAAADIGPCLDAIAAAHVADLEIIVVDDRSTDNTAEIARQHGARVVANPGPGHGAAPARNLGASLATSDILVFVDADVCVHPDTIERTLRQLEAERDLGGISGAYDEEPHAPGAISQWRNLLHCYTHRIARRETNTFWTGYGAMRRPLYLDAGGLDPAFECIEDMDLGHRLSSSGVRLRLDPTLQVKHRKNWSLASMARTDLFGRAIPYTRLLQREGMQNDLNVRQSQRICVALTGLALGLTVLSPFITWWLLAAAATCLAVIAGLNLDYYRFLAKCKGAWFAVKTFPCHLIYFAIGGTGFAWVHLRQRPAIPLLAFFLMAIALQVAHGAYGVEPYEWDEPAHIVTGLMVREYAARGFPEAPMAFARDYYAHYPKVAMGHWPPFFYVMQAAWTLVFPATRDSLLVMMALLAALLATGVWSIVRQAYGSLAAWCAGIVLLTSPVLARQDARVMTEIPMAVLMLGAIVFLGRYLDNQRWQDAAGFGLFSLLALLAKGSAFALAPVPVLAVILTRRWKLALSPSFWLPAAIAGLATTWYLFAPGGLHQQSAPYGGLRLITSRMEVPPRIWAEPFGWITASLILAGLVSILIQSARGRKLSGIAASAWALALTGSVFPLLVAVWERRHQVEEAAGFLIVAAIGLSSVLTAIRATPRVQAAVVVVVSLVAAGWNLSGIRRQQDYGYRAWADSLVQGKFGAAQAVFVCCEGASEGAMIAEVAQRERIPHRFMLRGTKHLAEMSWMGGDFRNKVSSPEQASEMLERLTVDVVAFDDRTISMLPGAKVLIQVLRDDPGTWLETQRSPLHWFVRATPQVLDARERERRLADAGSVTLR